MPKSGWVNDTCGAIYFQGKYHLYFQHNMFGTNWQNMTWGHAVSQDLIHWEYAKEAILPTSDGPAFTGSAVIAKNVPGVPDGALVIYYTLAGGASIWSQGKQFVQQMVWSEDGYTFHESKKGRLENILYENRDPKIYRYEKNGEAHWYMILFIDGHEYQILVSDDLLTWEKTQSIEIPQSWECPDLVELPVAGSQETKWLLWTPNSFYLVGDFDGRIFQPAQEGKLYYGNHRLPYAAQTFNNVPDRVIQIAHLGCRDQSFLKHRGMFAAPRTMQLRRAGQEYILAEPLIREITDRAQVIWEKKLQQENVTYTWEEEGAVLLHMKVDDAWPIEANICGSRLIWDPKMKKLAFSFADNHCTQEVRDITILVDRSAVEITVNEDTVLYYTQGGVEISKALTITGSMEISFARIRT